MREGGGALELEDNEDGGGCGGWAARASGKGEFLRRRALEEEEETGKQARSVEERLGRGERVEERLAVDPGALRRVAPRGVCELRGRDMACG